jgi:hypothetical protein
MAAPARQAANPCSIISGGCSGRLGFASLPCWAPVKAHVIITLPIYDSLLILLIRDQHELNPKSQISNFKFQITNKSQITKLKSETNL